MEEVGVSPEFEIRWITVIGRTKEDFEKHGTKTTAYIGKHIVGTGEDAHLTTKVYLDLLRPHVILVCGKRGTGKSYCAGCIIEEILKLEKEFLEKTAVVIFDPMGIYWSMKTPNEAQRDLLREWGLEPGGFENLKVYVPLELREAYEKAGISVDETVSISPAEFSPDDWTSAFNLERTGQFAITLENNFSDLVKGGKFSLDELAAKIEADPRASQHVKDVLLSLIRVAQGWGIFSKEGMRIHDIVKPGQITVIDLSRVRGEEWGVRSLIAAWITRQVYRQRVLARKEEELAKMERREPRQRFPMTWLIFEEAQNFIPDDRVVPSSQPIITIARQGREPGVGLMVITQMPNKVHADVLAQTDLVFSFRLTSREDLQALHAVMHTYAPGELWQYIQKLPRWPGAAVVLDDNLEKVYLVQIRPRISWHAGGTAAIV